MPTLLMLSAPIHVRGKPVAELTFRDPTLADRRAIAKATVSAIRASSQP